MLIEWGQLTGKATKRTKTYIKATPCQTAKTMVQKIDLHILISAETQDYGLTEEEEE